MINPGGQNVGATITIAKLFQVHSDSDIHLDATGSFKRFDSVDKDFRIALTTTSLMGDWKDSPQGEDGIPPQPLRPAPVPAPSPPPIKYAPLSPTVPKQSRLVRVCNY